MEEDTRPKRGEQLPPELQVRFEQLLQRQMVMVREEIREELHIGPLPSAKTIQDYEQVYKGAAKLVFTNFAEQGKHRRQMESFALKSGIIRSFTGLVAGFVIVISFLVVSYLLIKGGHAVSGTILGTVDLVALAGVFVYGSQVLRDERVNKAKIMAGREEQPNQQLEPGKNET